MASFEKRDNGNYTAVVSHTDEKGNRQRFKKTFEKKKDAVTWANDIENKLNNGYDIDRSKQPYSAFYREWLADFRLKKIRPSTARTYLSHAKHIDREFENIRMEQLTPAVVQRKLDKIGETHAPSWMNVFVGNVRSSLRYAHADGVLTKDLSIMLQSNGNAEHTRVDKNYLNAKEFNVVQSSLYMALKDTPTALYELMALIALETGARQGEVQALDTSDFDFNRNTMRIDQSYSIEEKKLTPPKTEASKRTVSITQSLSDVTQAYIKASRLTKLFEPYHSGVYFSRNTNKLTKELGVTPIKFHGYRHSHASILIHNDVAIEYISKRLGHATIKETLETYAHMLEEKEVSQSQLAVGVLEQNKNAQSPDVP